MGMVVTWFKPIQRGARSSEINVPRLTVIDRPKGLRFNSYLSKRLMMQGVKYVSVGVSEDENFIIVKPTYNKEEGFSLVGNEHSLQISAAALYHYLEQKGLVGKRFVGEWDDELMAYKFCLSNADSEDEIEEFSKTE